MTMTWRNVKLWSCLALGIGLFLMLLFSLPQQGHAEPESKPVTVILDGQTAAFDPAPFIQEGITMIPVRLLEQVEGLTLQWVGTAQQADLRYNDVAISLRPRDRAMTINDETVQLRAAPVLRNQRLFVPARDVAEALGMYVGWDPRTQTVYISSSFAGSEFAVPGDNVFLYSNLRAISNADEYFPAGGFFYFNDPPRYYFTVKDPLDKKVYDLAKILLYPEAYTTIKATYADSGSRVRIGISESQTAAENGAYGLLFELTEAEPAMHVTIHRLNLLDTYHDGIWSVPEMEMRLKHALLYFLGGDDGLAAYRDIYAAYMDLHINGEQKPFHKAYGAWRMDLSHADESMHITLIKGEIDE
jgi:hypothetical protein